MSLALMIYIQSANWTVGVEGWKTGIRAEPRVTEKLTNSSCLD